MKGKLVRFVLNENFFTSASDKICRPEVLQGNHEGRFCREVGYSS